MMEIFGRILIKFAVHLLAAWHIQAAAKVGKDGRAMVEDLNACEQCFGFGGGMKIMTPELFDPIPPKEFFNNYVYPVQKPVIMRGLVKDSVAAKNWANRDYLRSLNAPPDKKHRVEINKVQDASKPIIYMHFHDFVDIYKELPYYMVSTLPEFMRQDVPIPWPLQCDDVKDEILADLVLWFSSGGTNGYVHTDQVDNLHCVLSGSKYFIIVDPKYVDKIKFDNPVSTSSHINVNHVGYETRPELDEVEYYHANVSVGDCVYLPFEWIHQVRSFGETHIGLSIWWDYFNNTKIDFNKCNNEKPDESLTLSDMTIHPDDHNHHMGIIRDGIVRCVVKSLEDGDPGMTFKRYVKFTFKEMGSDLEMISQILQAALPYLRKLYNYIDTNADGLVVKEEVDSKTFDEWMKVRDMYLEFQRFVDGHLAQVTVDDEWWAHDELLKPEPDMEGAAAGGVDINGKEEL